MLILISIGIAGYGLYQATNGNLEPGIVLAAAGAFSFYLALKISDLKDRLDWAKAETHKLAKKSGKIEAKAGSS